jgi:hypothetical protein
MIKAQMSDCVLKSSTIWPEQGLKALKMDINLCVKAQISNGTFDAVKKA